MATDCSSKTVAATRVKPQEEANSCGVFVCGKPVLFRPMTKDDLDEVMAIERSAYRYPWSSGFFLQELQVTCARSILAELDSRICGYVLFWLLPGSIDVHNLAIAPEFRRLGIARMLMRQVMAAAGSQSATRVTLEVRQSNEAAKKLYASLGFVQTGLRKGYYSDDGEDAFTMALELEA
ncbi:MAG TPA: ribosomal protein S18-alanine N-acetyltransferase [Candidatus Binatia bacterium]|nr:ribosomal protein S18-alanine N-acetyltransferase [Candidatus Binatia bacterium]